MGVPKFLEVFGFVGFLGFFGLLGLLGFLGFLGFLGLWMHQFLEHDIKDDNFFCQKCSWLSIVCIG
jgi:hypothetical protein